MNRTIDDVLAWRARAPLRASFDTTVQDAAALMSADRGGAVLVMRDDRVAGIVTERDILSRVVAQGASSNQVVLEDIMTVKLTCIPRETTVAAALAIMTHLKVRHLPVTDDGTLLGIVSMRDLMAWLSREYAKEIDDLVSCIAGPAVRLRA